MAHVSFFISRQHYVIASFSFGMWTDMFFLALDIWRKVLWFLQKWCPALSSSADCNCDSCRYIEENFNPTAVMPLLRSASILFLGSTTELYCIVYLYSAQYLHILQDSKRYLTHLTAQVQSQIASNWHSPNWKIEVHHDHLSTSLRFFSLPLGIGPNDRGPPFKWSSEPLCICLYLGLNPRPLSS